MSGTMGARLSMFGDDCLDTERFVGKKEEFTTCPRNPSQKLPNMGLKYGRELKNCRYFGSLRTPNHVNCISWYYGFALRRNKRCRGWGGAYFGHLLEARLVPRGESLGPQTWIFPSQIYSGIDDHNFWCNNTTSLGPLALLACKKYSFRQLLALLPLT